MIRIIDEELREACAVGDEAKAQVLIGQGANVNSSNKVNGWTALHWAAYRGHRGLVMYLLNKGADPTIKNAKGETVTVLLSKYSLDLLDGKEVDEGTQYPLPSQQETLSSLPIVPNYIKNPEFPYNTKKEQYHLAPQAPAPQPLAPQPLAPQGVVPHQGVIPHQGAAPQAARSNSSSPQLPSTNSSQQFTSSSDHLDMETETRQGVLAPTMLASAGGKPGSISRYQLPHTKPVPNMYGHPSHPMFSTQQRHQTMLTAQPLFPNQPRTSPAVVHHPQLNQGHQLQLTSHGRPYPVSTMSMPVASEFPIRRIARPVYGVAQAGPVPGGGGPMIVTAPQHWGYNNAPHYRPQTGIVPQPVPSPGPPNNPLPLPPSPQIVNIPDSTQDKDLSTPVKGSPVRSPSANSVTSSPSADATIKVRLAGSEDFFEVELSDVGDTYPSLVKCFAEELDVETDNVAKIRKLPNILIRKDRDVKRIKSGSEFEVELAQDK